ncbi:MAG: ParB N-terminal domain-containing protein [archaeon]
MNKIKLIEISLLKPHEKIIPSRLLKIINSIRKNKTLFFPVVIDKTSLTILDGHHRVKAFRLLGIKKIPCFLVDYFSDEIKLLNRRKGFSATKSDVISRALIENLFPCKTTKHVLELFRINYKIGGNTMNKIKEIKTKNFEEGRSLWRHTTAC